MNQSKTEKRVLNFGCKIYVGYESNGYRNRTLSIEEYLHKIRPYLKDIMNNLKKTVHGEFR